MNPSQPSQGPTPPSPGNQPSHQNPYQSNPATQNPFPQQQFQPASQPPPTNGLAIASMVLGIISIFTCFFGVLFGGLAVIFGHISISKINSQNIGGKGIAIAGLTTGYIGLLLGILFIVGASQDSPEGSFSDIFSEAYEEEMRNQQQEIDPSSDQE